MKRFLVLLLLVLMSLKTYSQLTVPGTVTTSSSNPYLQFNSSVGVSDGTIRAISPVGTYSSLALWNASNMRWSIYNHHAPAAGVSNTLIFMNGAGSDKVSITQDGKFGIGTYNPTFPLHVIGTTDVEEMIETSTDGFASLTLMSNGKKWQWSKRPNVDGDVIQLYYHNGTAWSTPVMSIRPDGRVGIGSTFPDAKLTVAGTVHASEVKVDTSVPAPDYVFEKDYKLLSLSEIEQYVNENKHLPEVPSAKEMEANGINLSEMNMLLLKKVEELTLHLIEQDKLIKEMAQKITRVNHGK